MRLLSKNVKSFLESRSAPDIFYKLGKIDLKEISETVAMWNFLRSLPVYQKRNLLCIELGCGKRPTLSLILAHNIKSWYFLAVDPEIEEKDYNTDRFQYFKGKVEDLPCNYCREQISLDEIVVVANHSHTEAKDVLLLFDKFENLKTIHYITNPCCVNNVIRGIKGEFVYLPEILSDKNIIFYQVVKRRTNENNR